jgi:hypothetical protein
MTLIEMQLALRPEPQDAWARLAEAVERAGRVATTACAGLGLQDAPAELSRLEAALEGGLAALRDLGPPLEAFYAGLDERQRAQFDAPVRRRG